MLNPSFHPLRAASALVLATHLFVPCLAAADEVAPRPHEPRQALAEALFQEARDLVAKGKPELACPKFAESQRMDPATGTLLNLATCHEIVGKLASAWSEFSQALISAQHDGREDRVRLAKDRLRVLENKVPHVTIRVPAESANLPLDIRLDEVPVGRPAWGTALPVDPGKHVITARAPGRAPWLREVLVDAETREHTIDIDTNVEAFTYASDTEARKRRTIVRITGGVGAAGIVAGSLFGLYAFRRWHDADGACPTGKGCNPTAIDARSTANTSAICADIAFGIGIAGLAVASYVWATTPRPATASGMHIQAVPVLGPAAMGLGMEGQF